MRFQVPQFIETETKLVGPFTFKQFIYVAAGGLIIFLFRYIFSSAFLWVLASVLVAGIALGLAFYKIDGVPLPNYLVSAFSFFVGGKKYFYKKDGESSDELDQFLNQKNAQ